MVEQSRCCFNTVCWAFRAHQSFPEKTWFGNLLKETMPSMDAAAEETKCWKVNILCNIHP